MKTTIRPNSKHQLAAFSMIEMIGVLAVIAILAALLIPKVFDTITSAKINNTASSISTIKTAVVNHYGKYGALNTLSNTTVVAADALGTNYVNNVLLPEGFLDKPFESKLGTADSHIRMVACGAGAPTGVGASYWLSGQGAAAANECAVGTFIIEAMLKDVPILDAIELNNRIDGTTLGSADPTVADTKGRVQYVASTGGAAVDVYVYIAHK